MPDYSNYNFLLGTLANIETDAAIARYEAIAKARLFHAGTLHETIATKLADLLLIGEYEPEDFNSLYNMVDAVITEITNRLNVVGITNAPTTRQRPNANAQPILPLEAWWTITGLDALQHNLFTAAIRDGLAYLALDTGYPLSILLPTPYLHLEYVPSDYGGDDTGMVSHNRGGQNAAQPDWISHHYIEARAISDTETENIQRITIYIPHRPDWQQAGRIEYWENIDNEWKLAQTESANPRPWEGPSPVTCFRSPYGQFANNAIGPQILIDNAVAAFAATTVVAGAPPIVTIGMHATTDGQPLDEDTGENAMKLGPGSALAFPGVTPSEAEIKTLNWGNIRDAAHGIDKLISWLALAMKTPSLIQKISTTPEAAETLRQRDTYPTAVAERVQDALGNSFSSLLYAIPFTAQEMQAYDPAYTELGDALPHVVWSSADVRGILYEVDQETAYPEPTEPTPINAGT